MSPRRYLEFIREHSDIPRIKLGKLLLVPAGALEHKLVSLGAHAPAEAADDWPAPAGDEPRSVDDVLAQIGRKRRSTR